MKKAFTMVELIFVIVIIGILTAIAVPKFTTTRDDAIISKGKVAVAAMRSAIAMKRQKLILRGKFDDINGSMVEGLLDYNLSDSWSRRDNTFTFTDPSGNKCDFDVENNKLIRKDCNVTAMQKL